MKEITIFTPSYNRGNTLIRLYNSLLAQTNDNFKWLIVDDGSDDDTRNVVNNFINDGFLDINYIYQDNSGKYIAYNNAVLNCDTDFFLCVDSDDYLCPSAIEKIYNYISKTDLKNNDNILGLFFPRFDNSNLFGKIDDTFIFMDIMDLKFKYSKNIETAILLKTSFSKMCLFPIIDNEKFMSEEVIYNRLSTYGKFVYIEDFDIYINDYQLDGMTKNIYKYWRNSPNSTLLFLNNRYHFLKKYNFLIRSINRIKTVININALCLETRNNLLMFSPNKFLSILLFLPSILWKNKIFKKV